VQIRKQGDRPWCEIAWTASDNNEELVGWSTEGGVAVVLEDLTECHNVLRMIDGMSGLLFADWQPDKIEADSRDTVCPE
jgi:hypothetical protein